MKPRFIFTAVAAMCFIMVMTLPRLAMSTASAYAPANAAVSEGPLPILPIDVAAAEAAGAEAAAAEAAVAEAPAAEVAAVEPTPVPLIEGVPVETAAPVTAAESIPAAAPPSAASAAAASAAASAPAAEPTEFPALEAFAASLVNGQAQQVVGYYAPGLSALPVLQQPFGDNDFISDEYRSVTQYNKPNQYGVVGLLAHNTLSGREFFYLGQNQDIFLVYGDGRTRRYRVTRVQEYQALSPYDTRSDFVDLSNPGGPLLTHSEVFQRVYTGSGTLVLQTCIEANGEPTWGRLFVIAEPI